MTLDTLLWDRSERLNSRRGGWRIVGLRVVHKDATRFRRKRFHVLMDYEGGEISDRGMFSSKHATATEAIAKAEARWAELLTEHELAESHRAAGP